jgi:hypothetical protein
VENEAKTLSVIDPTSEFFCENVSHNIKKGFTFISLVHDFCSGTVSW